jgi:glycine/D-amino acid oxidase-like deaminating enzyme
MLTSTDIVIIGGGIAGCALLYELSRAGKGSVILLERGKLASATTAESGGFIRKFNLDPCMRDLAIESFEYYLNFNRETGKSCGFVQTGLVYRFPNSLAAELETLSVALNTPAYRITTIPSAQHLMIHEHAAACIDTVMTCRAWAQVAKSHGGLYKEHVEVERILMNDKAGIHGVTTSAGVIKTSKVIVAAGAMSKAILAASGVEVSFNPESFQYNIYRSVAHHLGCAYLDAVNQFYLFPLRNGDAVAGLLSDGKAVMASCFDHKPDINEASMLHHLVHDAFPKISNNDLHDIRLSYDAFTEDGRALMSELIPDLFVLSGLSAGGIKIAPALARRMVDVVFHSP